MLIHLKPFTIGLSMFCLLAPSSFAGDALSMATGKSAPLGSNAGASGLWDSHRPDSHAPIGVMGDHTHEAGEFMFSYRYMYMNMNESYLGDDTIGNARIIAPAAAGGQGFLVTPTKMTTEMHMAGLMFAPTDKLTLTAMVPWVSKEMSHLTRAGGTFTTRSEDWGDLKVGGLFKIYDANRQRIHLNMAVGIPTGSTSQTDFVPGLGITRLPYPMQTGSGTWDLHPGITYLGQHGNFSWGAQALGVIRLGDNDEGYTLGDGVTGHVWGAYKLADWLSVSSRFSIHNWGNIDGADRNLVTPATVVPTADPNRRGGTRIDYAAGINYYLRKGPLKGGRLAVEAGLPLYQDLDGPQLGTDWFLTAGLQYAF